MKSDSLVARLNSHYEERSYKKWNKKKIKSLHKNCLERTELQAYGFDNKLIGLVQDYLSNPKQRTKVEQEFSTLLEILSGFPERSILCPIISNIHFCDFFIIQSDTDIATFADDNTP